MGPLVNAEHKQFVTGWIEKSVEEGAELVLDGRQVAPVLAHQVGEPVDRRVGVDVQDQSLREFGHGVFGDGVNVASRLESMKYMRKTLAEGYYQYQTGYPIVRQGYRPGYTGFAQTGCR